MSIVLDVDVCMRGFVSYESRQTALERPVVFECIQEHVSWRGIRSCCRRVIITVCLTKINMQREILESKTKTEQDRMTTPTDVTDVDRLYGLSWKPSYQNPNCSTKSCHDASRIYGACPVVEDVDGESD